MLGWIVVEQDVFLIVATLSVVCELGGLPGLDAFLRLRIEDLAARRICAPILAFALRSALDNDQQPASRSKKKSVIG